MSQIQKAKESLTTALEALEAETDEVVKGSNRLNDNLAKAGKKIWRQVLVIWAVGIVLAISYFLVLRYKPATVTQTHQRPVDQPVAEAKPGTARVPEASQPLKAIPPTSAQEGLLKLLSQIQEAQLKKDIHMFMAAYSPDFPGLVQKKETTLNIWKKYTYVDSQFKLTDLLQKNPLTIVGKVIWNIKAKDQKTGTTRNVTKAYSVIFSKESGKWLIQRIEKIDG
jgi:hypothetical protein